MNMIYFLNAYKVVKHIKTVGRAQTVDRRL